MEGINSYEKKALFVLLALIMILGQLSVMEEPVYAATKSKSWQDAYAKILKSPKEFYKLWGSEDESAYNKYLLTPGGWSREITKRELAISDTFAVVNMNLSSGVREMHSHQQSEWGGHIKTM